MMQTTDMATDRRHQFKIMLSDSEKLALEAVAESRGLTSSDVLRLHIRESYEALQERQRVQGDQDDFRWKEHHTDVLHLVAAERDPIDRDDISTAMADGAPFSGVHYGGWAGLGLALNQLARNGHLRRLKTGYVITPKGKATIGMK